MKKELRILVLEDVAADVILMSHELRSGGLAFEAKRVETREEFLRELDVNPPDLILSDHGLPNFDGFTALAMARERCPDIPFIFVTGSMGEELAIDSLRSGATDYVLKTRISNLGPAVERALRLKRLRKSEERYRRLLEAFPDALIVVRESRIVFLNQAAQRLLGPSGPEKLIGRLLVEFAPEAARERIEQRLRDAASRDSNDPWQTTAGGRFAEEHLRRADGSEILVEMTATPLTYEDEPAVQVTLRDVTGQRAAATALRESEARKTAILDASLDAIVSIDDRGIVREWNSAAQRIFGYRRENALGQRLDAMIVPPNATAKNIPGLADYLRTGDASLFGRPVEVMAMRQTGDRFPIELALTRIPSSDPPLFTAFIRDITERKNAEEALRRSEARKAAVLETALDAIISIAEDGKIIEWNPAAERIFGYSRELALGRDLTELIAPKSNAELHRKGLARFLQTGRGRMLGRRTEMTALRANGAEFPVELTITKIAGEGSPVFTTFVRDITERRRTEEALRKSEERFRLLVEGVEDYAIYMLDPHGRITTWNAGAERIMGYRAREIMGRRFHRFYRADDVERKKPDQALAVATAEGRFIDERGQVRKDGTQYWASFVITALRDDAGVLTGFSTISRDVSKRKHAEDEIHRLNGELEDRVRERTSELQAAYREMEAFSYSISHDLRAPLIHIAGFVEMLKSDLGPGLDEKSRRHLQTICDSTENMGRMIADLLTFSRIGRADLHKVRFNLTDTLKDVRRDLQAQTQNRKVTWIVPELPEVYGDPFMLRQALYNLIGNALKFTRNRAEARIEVSVETMDREHIFAVRDNGAGFDMKYASKLFGVFQRLHSANEFEGTGIGLANVRRIVARHGGRTWAEGELDAGARFYFSLPVAEEAKP